MGRAVVVGQAAGVEEALGWGGGTSLIYQNYEVDTLLRVRRTCSGKPTDSAGCLSPSETDTFALFWCHPDILPIDV